MCIRDRYWGCGTGSSTIYGALLFIDVDDAHEKRLIFSRLEFLSPAFLSPQFEDKLAAAFAP